MLPTVITSQLFEFANRRELTERCTSDSETEGK